MKEIGTELMTRLPPDQVHIETMACILKSGHLIRPRERGHSDLCASHIPRGCTCARVREFKSDKQIVGDDDVVRL